MPPSSHNSSGIPCFESCCAWKISSGTGHFLVERNYPRKKCCHHYSLENALIAWANFHSAPSRTHKLYPSYKIRVSNDFEKFLSLKFHQRKDVSKKAAVGHIPGMKQEQKKLKLDTVEVNVGRSIENKNGQSKINTCHKSQWKAPTFSMPWQRKLLGCLLFDFAFIAWLIMMRYLFSFSFFPFERLVDANSRWASHKLCNYSFHLLFLALPTQICIHLASRKSHSHYSVCVASELSANLGQETFSSLSQASDTRCISPRVSFVLGQNENIFMPYRKRGLRRMKTMNCSEVHTYCETRHNINCN